ARQSGQIPADVLAGAAHAGALTVESVVIFQVAQQMLAQFAVGGRGQMGAVRQVVGYFAEDPGPSLGGAADHDGVGSSVIQDAAGLLRRVDVAVGDQRDADFPADFPERVVFGLPCVQVAAGAAVQRQGGNAAVFSQAGD